jgi:hypothetical protein
VRKLFKDGVSQQTTRFVEGFCDRNKDEKFHSGVLVCIKEMKKDIFEHICHAGMPNLYSFLFGEVFGGLKVKEWILKSHKATVNGWSWPFSSDNMMSLYFYACCSSPQLAELLSEWCPMLHEVDDVEKLFDALAERTKSLHCLEIALSRVEDWKSRWPRATFFDKYLDYGFPTELYEFVLQNCPDIDIDGLIQKIFSKKGCCNEIFHLFLRLGEDLNCENNGARLAHIIFSNINKDCHIDLLKFAIKVGKHFQVTENIDSEESLLLRKNIGAKSPQELGLDSNSDEGRGLYLKYVVECVCALLDTGECEPFRIFGSTNQVELILKQISNIPELRPIATTFKLQLMRIYRTEALRIFQEVQQWIPRDFKYSCGCTLVHDACRYSNLPLLEVLDQNGFDLKITNKKGETPLHWATRSVYEGTECTEYLLKRLLGQFYVPLDAKREEIVGRTPDEQRHVKDTLSQRDAKGRTPLLAALTWFNLNNAKLLIYNLLGPLAILENEEVVTRTELEQQHVDRILSVSDVNGHTALHGAMNSYRNFDFLMEVILKNLLTKYFIDGTKKPMLRTLEKQKQIAQLLQSKNKKGQTPLLYGAIHHDDVYYLSHELFLMNLLGEYFVEMDGTTAKPLNARTDEENQFVRSVMFGEDDEGCSPYGSVQTGDDKYYKDLQLLYTANASYLLSSKKNV